MPRIAARSAGAIAVALILAAGAAPRATRAVTDEEVFRTFRFNFVNPGGRAGAMGGSFIGIADDATAAAANPAGLTNLIATELFTELRLEDADGVLLTAAIRDPRGGATILRTDAAADADNILHPSFLSFVHPLKRWVFGISRQEVLRNDVDAFNAFTNAPTFPTTTIVEAQGYIETLYDSYNASFGFRGGEKFAGGVTLSYARMDVESRTANTFNFGSGLSNDYATSIDDRDDDFTFAAGVLIKPHQKVHVGLVYRAGPEFAFEERIEDTRTNPCQYPSAGVLADFIGNRNAARDASCDGFAPSMFDDPTSFRNHFKVPDQYGLGLGIRPTQSFTIALDAVHVEFSDLTEGFVGNVNALTFPGDPLDCDFSQPLETGGFACDYTTPNAVYAVDDSTIVRLGFEYVWSLGDKMPMAIRWGAYADPNPRLEAKFGEGGVFIAENDTFPEGDSATHYTVGFGFVAKEKFQADFAADLSTLVNSYVASFIFHF